MTLLSKRTVPYAPASLVKCPSSTAASTSGSLRSTPTSDHVPDEMYAHPGASGVPTTALAVSCAAGATTSGGRVVPGGRNSGFNAPSGVPAWTIGAMMPAGRPSRANSSRSQSPAAWWSSCVVDAMVRSEQSDPQRKRWQRSGTSNNRCVAGGRPARAWANNWNNVFSCMDWMPVRAKISARGTTAHTACTIPSVRPSR